MEVRGIDVSKWQGKIDWARVKSSGSAGFAIIRAGYGSLVKQKDTRFDENYEACKRLGIPVGAYWYSYATTTTGAIREAHAFMKVVAGKTFEYPLWFDQEYEKKIKALSNEKRTEIVKAFCAELEKNGYYTGLYCSRDWLQNYVNAEDLKHLDIWVAAYGSSAGNVPLPYGMWQCSSTGKVNGIMGNVDIDIAYKDYPAIMKKSHLNGF